MFDFKWLQLFAEGGEGGEAAATGETAGVADQYTENLVALGVPREKIRARKAPAVKQEAPKEAAPVEQKGEEQAAAVTEQKRMTWDEIMADSEYNEVQGCTERGRGQAQQACSRVGSHGTEVRYGCQRSGL